MNKTKTLLAVALLACGLFTGCKMTDATGVRVPDPATTEKVKAVAEGVSTLALRRALVRFTNDAPTIAMYARAVGGIFCEMQTTRQFSPEALEAGIAALVLPEIQNEEARAYIQDARDVLRVVYRSFYAERFNAELDPNEWPAAVADIFCNSINRGLIDSGRPGVK